MHYTLQDEIFNPSPFFQMPFYPMSKYLDEITKQLKAEQNN
jgi:hypothetical protein